MSEVLVKRIMSLCGPMPNPEAHKNYLRSLSAAALSTRLFTLEQQSPKHEKIEPLPNFLNRAADRIPGTETPAHRLQPDRSAFPRRDAGAAVGI